MTAVELESQALLVNNGPALWRRIELGKCRKK